MLSYLLRSLKRQPLRHFSIFWIMLCAFLLPLTVSVYRDSLRYGWQCQIYQFGHGQAVHISGAQPEDVDLFLGIDGLTEPFYEDGTVYLTYDSEESKQLYENRDDFHEGLALANLLKARAKQSERKLEVVIFGMDSLDDPELNAVLAKMQLASFVLLLFSGFIVQAAYRSHIDSFSQELHDLAAIGTAKGQIIGMFLAELLLLFPLASIAAVGIAYTVMRVLYEHYLGNTAPSVAVWQVFHMDAKNTAVQESFYLAVCLGAMLYALLKKPAPARIASVKKETSLPQLWVRRTKTPFVSCFLILIPLLTAFLILFNQYLSTYAKMVYDPEYKPITVSGTAQGFSQSDLDAVSKISGVDRVEGTWDFSEPFLLGVPDMGSIMVSMHLADELPGDMPKLEKGQFICDLPGERDTDGTYSLSRIPAPKNEIEVTPLQWLPYDEEVQSEINLYVSRETLQQLGYTKLLVYTRPDRAAGVEEALMQRFPSVYSIIYNYQNYVDATLSKQVGLLWLLSWISGTLMVVAMQIVWVRLSSYVRDCEQMLRIIQQVGASRAQIARLIPIRRAAILAAVLPFAIAIPFAWLEANRNGRPFILSVPVIAIYLGIAALSAVTILLPVRYTLNRILK